MGKRDEFTQPTKQAMAMRVAYKCSFPKCQQVTVGPSSESPESTSNVGMACHISGASSGSGSRRYDFNMTSKQRSSIENGIWMCYTHGKLIDTDDVSYTPKELKEWKMLAEKKANEALTGTDTTLNNSTLHSKWVQALESLHALLVDIIPRREHEDQDWDDAMRIVGSEIVRHEESLRQFDKNHGGLLPKKVKSLLEEAKSLANEGSLSHPIISFEDLVDHETTKGELAKRMVTLLEEAKVLLQTSVFA